MSTALVYRRHVRHRAWPSAAEHAERGHDLVLVARDRTRLENVSDELTRDVQGRGRGAASPTCPTGPQVQHGRRPARRRRRARSTCWSTTPGYGMSQQLPRATSSTTRRRCSTCCAARCSCSRTRRRVAMRARGHGAHRQRVVGGRVRRRWAPTPRPRPWCTVVHRGARQRARRLRRHGDGAAAPGSRTPSSTQRAGLDMSRLPDFLWLEADAARARLPRRRRRRARSCQRAGAAVQGADRCPPGASPKARTSHVRHPSRRCVAAAAEVRRVRHTGALSVPGVRRKALWINGIGGEGAVGGRR